MLSFEIVQPAKRKAIQICCDDEGLSMLIQALERVRSENHLHLRAPSAGGNQLNDVTPFGEEAIGEVIVTKGGD